MKLTQLVSRHGVATDLAGRCMVRASAPGRTFTTFHPDAPRGVTTCAVCGRVVVRGLTDWWAR